MRYLSIVIFCFGLFFSGRSFGGEYIDQVKAQLLTVKSAGMSNGWKETHNEKFDKLNRGQSDSFSFTLKKNTSYKIISVCDQDCSDLDLILYDENGNVIDTEHTPIGHDLPVVEVTPKWTGKFQLKVNMRSCNNNPCYYGISILGEDTR